MTVLHDDPGMSDARFLAAAVDFARSFGLEPAFDITPEFLADQGRHVAANLRRAPLGTVTTLSDYIDGEEIAAFSRVYVHDNEYVYDDASYPSLLRAAARAAGTADLIAEASSRLDVDGTGTGTFAYTVNGRRREHSFALDRDWGDPAVEEELFEDVTPDGHRHVSFGGEVHYWVAPELSGDLLRVLMDEDRWFHSS